MTQRVKRAIAAAMSLTMLAAATPVSPLYNAIQNAVSSVMMQASAADNKYIINYDNDTFSIASFDDLNMFAEAVNVGNTFENKTITLADNFDMGTNALTTPIGTYEHSFKGTFDGNNKTIKLNIESAKGYAGLFGYVDGATIRNITVTGYAYCADVAGGICGQAVSSNVYNCANIAEVTGGSTAGGILGYATYDLNVYNCTNNAAVKATNGAYGYAGGILGYADEYAYLSVYNCANIATVTSEYGAGGICGYSFFSPLVHNCINIAAVSGQTDIGGICGGSSEDPYIDNCYVLNKFNENDVTVINAQQFKGTDKVSDNKTVTELLNDYVDEFNSTDITLLEWEQGQDYPILKIPVSQDAYTKIEGTNLQWTIDEGKLTIERIDETITDENLNAMPDWYGDIHSPWYNNTEITSVQIKDGVTNIGSDAFKGCSGLTSIAIPNSVTSFGGNAFNGCSKLTEITIPSGVTEIGRSAFENWSGLTSITIPSGVTTIGDYAFRGCSALTEVTIPSGVTSIGEWAFNGCELLESITLPSDVTSISSRTFEECSALKEITIPSGVTKFYDNAFSCCTALTSIKFEGDVPEIKDGWEEEADAFEDVGKTTPAILYYPKDNASWDNLLAENAESIAENGFLSWKGGYFTPEAYLNWNDIDETGLCWSISANGTLYIDKQETPSGSNFTIPDFDGNAPWKDYVNQIRFVNISKDVENVNDTSFKDLIGHAFLILEDGYNGTKPSPIDDSTYDSFGGGEFIYSKSQLTGASLSLDGKIGVNISFYVNKNEGSAITINGETVDLAQLTSVNGVYTYTLWVAPKDAFNDITFKTVKGSDTIVEQTYSVKSQYVDVVLADTEHKKYNERVFDMVTALDTYMNSSRVYFGIETDSDKITEINSAIDKITVVIPSEIETPVFNETMYYGSSLILDSGVKVRHYIKIADGTDISKFKLAVNGNDITDAELTKSGIKSGSDDVYFFETDEFNPIDFDKKVSVTYDGTNVIDKYSVLSYIKLALNNETTKDTKLGTMCKALYNYYVEVGKY